MPNSSGLTSIPDPYSALAGGTMTVGGMRHYSTYRAMATGDQQHA